MATQKTIVCGPLSIAEYQDCGVRKDDRKIIRQDSCYGANGQRLTATDNAANKTVSFAYNPRGLLAQATDVHGATEIFTYDAAGNLSQRDDSVAGQNFTTTYAYTPRNQLKSLTRGGDATSYTYDAAGNLVQKTYPNGVNTAYTYDDNGRPTSQQAVKGTETLQSFAQSFDAAGNIILLTENGTVNTTYAYDALNRLTQENISGYGAVSYTYDRAGNRLSVSNPTTGQTTYSYNPANQLTSSVNGGATTNYSYNAGGALSQKSTGTNVTTYSYNGLDKLTQVGLPHATVSYAYDPLGRRIQRTEGESATNFHLSGKSDLSDYETADGIVPALSTAYQRGADGLISATTYDALMQPTNSYYHYNLHGDTSGQTDANGNLTRSYRYDAFGNVVDKKAYIYDPLSGQRIVSPVDPPELTYGYTGKWQRDKDLTTGQIRMGVREYEPQAGRFASLDPLKGDPTEPMQRNRYTYVGNNPLMRYDLNGQYWGESYVNAAKDWAEEKISDFTKYTHRSEFTPLTGYIPPEKRLLHDNKYVQILNEPAIETGAFIGIGSLGGAGFISRSTASYSAETESFYGGSRVSGLRQKGPGENSPVCPTGLNATIARIEANQRLPFRNDMTTFHNREGLLPKKPSGYYTEYVHPTFGMSGPGAQRVVTGQNGEIYYSPDHYITFIRINP